MDLFDLYYCYNNEQKTLDELTPFNTEFTLIDEAMYGFQGAGVVMSISEIKNQSDIRHMSTTMRNEYTIFDFNDVHMPDQLSELTYYSENLSYLGGAIDYDFVPYLNTKYLKWYKLINAERG